MSDTSKILIAAFAGAVVGAGIALLLAPASGEETRKKISKKIKQWKDSIDNEVNDVSDDLFTEKVGNETH